MDDFSNETINQGLFIFTRVFEIRLKLKLKLTQPIQRRQFMQIHIFPLSPPPISYLYIFLIFCSCHLKTKQKTVQEEKD